MDRCSFFYSLPLLIIMVLFGATFQIKLVAVKALPLNTNGRWIVNEGGKRVKLACVNWVSHLEPKVAEGLSKQPLDVIAKKIKSMGFNCVRLTWPLLLVTNDSLASLTVRHSFQDLNLLEALSGIQANNPTIIDLPLMDAYKAVVKSLGDNEVMVILDNHITVPGWCCGYSDGNGFFGDQYFDPGLWISGLNKMATIFKGASNVVGMSLRNELRGPRQNVEDWYRYMPKGAEAVHAANPDVLVILSGLSYDTDLSFLQNRPVSLSFNGKLVFELHWYAWSSGDPNQACDQIKGNIMNKAGFLLGQGWPLFVSEFGLDMRGINGNDNRYFDCFIRVALDLDFDWALWTLGGSYYLRQGIVGMEEFYGLVTSDWSQVRNASYLKRISRIQLPSKSRGSITLSKTNAYKVIFHPLTGLCILRKSRIDPLSLGPCSSSNDWEYTPQKILSMKGTYFCLRAEGEGKAAKLGTACSISNSRWETMSNPNMQLSSKISNGSNVCLDVDANNIIVTNTCKCQNTDSTCNPASQWFNFIDSTR